MSKAAESLLRGAREALAFTRGEMIDAVVHIPTMVNGSPTPVRREPRS